MPEIGPPNVVELRVFTSTNTSVFLSQATMSSSPSAQPAAFEDRQPVGDEYVGGELLAEPADCILHPHALEPIVPRPDSAPRAG